MNRLVYVTIGNSDDRLTQAQWSRFCADVEQAVAQYAVVVRVAGFSLPMRERQNACWGFDIADDQGISRLRWRLEEIRKDYGQDSIAWADAGLTLIGASPMVEVEL